MPKTCYFDSNALVDVFEGREPSLLPQIEEMIADNKLTIICSDLNLAELLSGNHLPNFAVGLDRLLAASPRWLLITSLTTREVIHEYGNPKHARVKTPVGAFLQWSEFLPLVTSEEERGGVSSDLAAPTSEALLELYKVGTVRQRIKEYWQPELTAMQDNLRDRMVYVGTVRNLFWKIVAETIRRNLGQSEEFVRELWDNPDRAPAFRLEIELGCKKLNVPQPRWTVNDFYDHLHVGALPYVDLFVTRDAKLVNQIKWFDSEVRVPRGADPYMAKVCDQWAELANRV